jgi:hypothetical protein
MRLGAGWMGLIAIGVCNSVSAAAITQAALSSYIETDHAGFKGTVGALEFSKFTLTSDDLTPTDVTVKPIIIGAAMGLEFSFQLQLDTNLAAQKKATFGYTVTSPSGITSAKLSFLGLASDPGTTAKVTENVGGQELVVFEMTPGTETTSEKNASVVFTNPQLSLVVTDEAFVSTSATGNDRVASIASFTNLFTVPEPASSLLLAAGGFLCLAMAAQRRAAKLTLRRASTTSGNSTA